MYRFNGILIVLILGCTLTACGPRSVRSIQAELEEEALGDGGVQLKDVRKFPPDFKRKAFQIDREKFRGSFDLSAGGAAGRTAYEAARVVEVFDRKQTSTGFPEYRLFGITEGSPYDLLGLKNGDVIIAANDWVVFSPGKFKKYVYLLQGEDTANIELRRAGEAMLFQYSFE